MRFRPSWRLYGKSSKSAALLHRSTQYVQRLHGDVSSLMTHVNQATLAENARLRDELAKIQEVRKSDDERHAREKQELEVRLQIPFVNLQH